jgi:hypothetical protein
VGACGHAKALGRNPVGIGADLMIGDADGSRYLCGLFGYQGFGSGVSIEFQAVARFRGSMERPDCKLMFHLIL